MQADDDASRKKKRKWDVAAPGLDLNEPPPPPPSNDVTEQPSVEEIAAKINASLAQRTNFVKAGTNPDIFEEDININSSPARVTLTKGSTHRQIAEESGATIVTRGEYHPPHMPVEDEKKVLHLHIEAKTQESLDKAVEAVKQIMQEQKSPPTFTCKVMANLPEGAEFRAKGKIVGPHGSFVKFIQRKAGVRVQLRGRGSGFRENPDSAPETDEPLHLYIVAQSEEALEEGKKQAENLLDHVRQDMTKMAVRPPAPGVPPPPGAPPPPGPSPPMPGIPYTTPQGVHPYPPPPVHPYAPPTPGASYVMPPIPGSYPYPMATPGYYPMPPLPEGQAPPQPPGPPPPKGPHPSQALYPPPPPQPPQPPQPPPPSQPPQPPQPPTDYTREKRDSFTEYPPSKRQKYDEDSKSTSNSSDDPLDPTSASFQSDLREMTENPQASTI